MANSNLKNVNAHVSVTNGSPSNSPHWRPGLRQTPWIAVMWILTALACMGASAGVIIGSNKKTVASWKISPAVLLAVLSSILNFALYAALVIGVAITWWRSALWGTTLPQLHYIWDRGAGFSFIKALRSGVDARKITLSTALIAAAQFANNPLLQRSTNVRADNIVTDETMALNLTRQLPDGWLGSIQNASTATIIGSRNGISSFQGWWLNKTLSTSNETSSYCNGTCRGKVQGAGISHSCISTTQALDLSLKENDGAVLFAINTTLSTNSTGAPVLVLTTLHASEIDNSCIATLTIDTCNIEAAVVEYPIVIQSTTIALDTEKLPNMTVVSTYISPGDSPTAAKGQGAGPLEGLNDFQGFYLAANTSLMIDPTRSNSYYSGGSLLADLFFIPEVSNYDDSIRRCALKFSSPTNYVLDSMHYFMFRASLQASSATDLQNFSVQRTNLTLIFHSNYRYLAAALAVMMVALLTLLFPLWGCWELGRPVTLSPLETAKALGATVLQNASSDSAIGGMLKALTNTPMVKYDGERISSDGGIISQNTEGRTGEASEEGATENGHQMLPNPAEPGEVEPV
jgi:hypothetical protein